MGAVFRRELAAYFITPIGAVYLAVFWLLAGYQFTLLLLSGSAEMASEFSFLYVIVLLLTPILTMRLMSEDRRQKTDQLLFSAPVSLPGVVAGKYLAAGMVYLAGIGITIPFVLVLSCFAQVNKAIFFGNFLGIFLMGMAAIAVCMFVSSLTENQIIAAIGGFAAMLLILSLNRMAGFLPASPVRSFLSGISFYSRYHSLTLGILRGADLFFFVTFAGIFLFLTARVLDGRRWSGGHKYGALAVVITILGILLVLAANVVMEGMTDRLGWQTDLTENSRYAISEETEKVLGELAKDVEITVLNKESALAEGSAYAAQAYQILKQYRRGSDHIHLSFLDLAENPTFASRYPDLALSAWMILVEAEEKREVLTFAEMFDIAEDGNTITASRVEQKVTNAILSVTSETKPVAEVLTGYGSSEPEELMDLLASSQFEVRTRSLLTEEISQDADVAVLYAPEGDLESASLKKLDSWLDNGGEQGKSLFLFLTPNSGEMPRLQEFLADWGLAMGEGLAFEANQNLYYGQPWFPIAQFGDMEYAEGMTARDLVIMGYCRPVDVLFESKDNVETRILLQFTNSSGFVPMGAENITQQDVTGDVKAAVLGIHSWYGQAVTRSQVVLSGSAFAVTGEMTTSTTFANGKYFLNLFRHFSEKNPAGVSIPVKDLTQVSHSMSSGQVNRTIWAFMVILPAAVLIAGLAVWLRRRHL